MVVGWNGAELLPGCLRALVAQLRPADELIVVDNASTDRTVDIVRTEFPGAALVVNDRNLGFAGGANVGLAAAEGNALLLVNQDVVVRAGWVAAILAALRPVDVGVVGSKLLYPDGRLQHAGGSISYPLALPDHAGYRQTDHGQWDEVRAVDFVTGAAIGIARELVDRVGVFDAGFYPAYYEETDLCTRAIKAGFRVLYAPEAVAVHQETSSSVRESPEYHRWMARGRMRYVLKHYSAAQFNSDFLPAERMYSAALRAPEMREGLRMAYLDTLMSLRDIPGTGVLSDPADVDGVAEAIADLRSRMWRLSGQEAPIAARTLWAPACATLQPRTAREPTTWWGQLRSAVAGLWRRFEHSWYLRHLLLRRELRLTQQTVMALDRETTDAYRALTQSLYGLRDLLDGLEARLNALERRPRHEEAPERGA